jgi:hypothetical protein
MWLPNAIIKDVDEGVAVFYVPFSTCRYWAEHRAPGEPLVFSGWYWAEGAREGGPFKSKSACYRDAWYRAVRHKQPPKLRADALNAEREIEEARNKVVRLPVRRQKWRAA